MNSRECRLETKWQTGNEKNKQKDINETRQT